MTRINFSSARGTNNFEKAVSTLVFAGILIVCSVAIGCSSEKPTTSTPINQPVMAQAMPSVAATPTATAPVAKPAAKPVHKKIVRKVPATVTYASETSGISFQYPRKYSLKTGEEADKLVSSESIPMNFVQTGGTALAAVVVPESAYPKSDLASAFFDVSVNKALTAEQCGEFSAPEGKDATSPAPQTTKLMIGDMQLQSAETATNDGSREETSKYYHVFENGACYEVAIKVATELETDEGGKPVDRDEIFKRLEKILATVKIS